METREWVAEDFRRVRVWLDRRDRGSMCPWGAVDICDEQNGQKCDSLLKEMGVVLPSAPSPFHCPCHRLSTDKVTETARHWLALHGEADV